MGAESTGIGATLEEKETGIDFGRRVEAAGGYRMKASTLEG
jgi:hypothetical protein